MGSLEGKSASRRLMVAKGPSVRGLVPYQLLCGSRLLLALLAILLTAGLLTTWYLLAWPSAEYILVVDAGSSGTRLYAYTWRPGAAPGDPPVVENIPPGAAARQVPRKAMPAKRAYQRVETEPGLDQFVGDDKELRSKSLGPLLGWAQAVVPRRRWATTPVFLCATAGLRKLPEEQQESLMAGVRAVLHHSPFRFEDGWARIISGEDEGVYGWIALNYMAGAFSGISTHSPSSEPAAVDGGDAAAAAAAAQQGRSVRMEKLRLRRATPGRPGGTIGILDLGGSSLEVAFELDGRSAMHDELSGDTVNVTVFGQTYQLYVHVHHHYGLNDAFERSISLLLSPQPPLSPSHGPLRLDADGALAARGHQGTSGVAEDGVAAAAADVATDAGSDSPAAVHDVSERSGRIGSREGALDSPDSTGGTAGRGEARGEDSSTGGLARRRDAEVVGVNDEEAGFALPTEPSPLVKPSAVQMKRASGGGGGRIRGSGGGSTSSGDGKSGSGSSKGKVEGKGADGAAMGAAADTIPLPRSGAGFESGAGQREQLVGGSLGASEGASAGDDQREQEGEGGSDVSHLRLGDVAADMAADLAAYEAQLGKQEAAVREEQQQQQAQQEAAWADSLLGLDDDDEEEGGREGEGEGDSEEEEMEGQLRPNSRRLLMEVLLQALRSKGGNLLSEGLLATPWAAWEQQRREATAAAAYDEIGRQLLADELALQPQAYMQQRPGSGGRDPLALLSEHRRRQLLSHGPGEGGAAEAAESDRQSIGSNGSEAGAAPRSVREDPPGSDATPDATTAEGRPGAAADAAGSTAAGTAERLPQVAHPCLHAGYAKPYTRLAIQGSTPDPPEVMLVGRPNHDACAELAASVVNATARCGAPSCALGAPQPTTAGAFQALTGFYVVYHFFGLHSHKEMQRLEQMGREFCSKSWEQVEVERANEIHIDRYCFRAPFVLALLGQGLGVDEGRVELGSPNVGWTLGAALAEGSRLGLSGNGGGGSSGQLVALTRKAGMLHLPHIGRRGWKVLAAGTGATAIVLFAALTRRRSGGTGTDGGGSKAINGAPATAGASSELSRLLGGIRGDHFAGAADRADFLPTQSGGREREGELGLGMGGLGGMMALPSSPRQDQLLLLQPAATHQPSSPILSRFFGTPPKKRLEPPMRDISVRSGGFAGTAGSQRELRRDVSLTSLSRMSRSRSQAVSRRGMSVDELLV